MQQIEFEKIYKLGQEEGHVLFVPQNIDNNDRAQRLSLAKAYDRLLRLQILSGVISPQEQH